MPGRFEPSSEDRKKMNDWIASTGGGRLIMGVFAVVVVAFVIAAFTG